MPSNPRYLAALQGEQLKRVAERSFPAFVRQAWPILEPTTAFLQNWHIDLVCEYLEAVTAGEIRRLVINLPPRYGKSLLVTILWPVWEWIRHPATRWVFTSYAESLAGQHSQDRRTLLQSPWYCRHWGPRVSLTHPTEASEYWNAQRGRMLATSVGAAVTGKGGNRIVVDDPHTPLGAESAAQRHRVIEYFRRSVATRLDDKQRGAIVVVMQRLHAQDLTATCLDLGYTPLCLPAEATSRTTITFPRSGRVVTRAPGDLLWPAREGPEEMAQRTVELGAYGFAGQYQQSPSPRTGGLFERRWWAFYDDLPTGVDAGIQSWDLSVKGGPGHDFVVGLVAAGRKTRRVHIAGIHPQPDGRWMEQMARNLTDPVDGFLRTVRQLIHDCDPLYTRVCGEILTSGDVGPIRLPPKSPNLNAYAERFVRSIKEECLHRVVPLGEGHLRLIVHEYVEHYHRERNHQGLDNQLLQRPPPPVRADADVQRRERLGGLLSFYYREAA